MATAPRPGVSRRAAADAATQSVLVLSVQGKEHRFALNNVPIGEQELCVKQSGFTYETFITEPFGTIKLIGLWWLARRAGGETRLTWQQVKDEWPSDLTEDDIDLRIEEPDETANDPEA
jgi:hypothetical protein